MIDQTVYLATLFVGGGTGPKLAHLAGLALPPLCMGLCLYRANKVLAAVGFATLHVLFYAAVARLSSGAYTYFLYTLTAPLTGGGYLELMAPTLTDTLLVFGLPPVLHAVAVPVLGLAIWRGARRARRD